MLSALPNSFHVLPSTPLTAERVMGIFDKKEPPKKPDFSSVQSGSSSSAPAPSAAPASTPATSVRSYTVRSGDSLSAIAKREYGDANAWRRIFDANRDQLDNPDLIHPGQELKIPAVGGES